MSKKLAVLSLAAMLLLTFLLPGWSAVAIEDYDYVSITTSATTPKASPATTRKTGAELNLPNVGPEVGGWEVAGYYGDVTMGPRFEWYSTAYTNPAALAGYDRFEVYLKLNNLTDIDGEFIKVKVAMGIHASGQVTSEPVYYIPKSEAVNGWVRLNIPFSDIDSWDVAEGIFACEVVVQNKNLYRDTSMLISDFLAVKDSYPPESIPCNFTHNWAQEKNAQGEQANPYAVRMSDMGVPGKAGLGGWSSDSPVDTPLTANAFTMVKYNAYDKNVSVKDFVDAGMDSLLFYVKAAPLNGDTNAMFPYGEPNATITINLWYNGSYGTETFTRVIDKNTLVAGYVPIVIPFTEFNHYSDFSNAGRAINFFEIQIAKCTDWSLMLYTSDVMGVNYSAFIAADAEQYVPQNVGYAILTKLETIDSNKFQNLRIGGQVKFSSENIETGATNDTIDVGGVTYNVKGWGMLIDVNISNPATIDKNMVIGGSEAPIRVDSTVDYSAETVGGVTTTTYAIIVKNITKARVGTKIYHRPYIICELGGNEYYFYGDIDFASVNDVWNAYKGLGGAPVEGENDTPPWYVAD